MVQSFPQRDFLRPGSPTHQWCTDPGSCAAFWPHAGSAAGIKAAIQARGPVDAERRARVAACMRRQYAAAQIAPPEALDAFAQSAEVIAVGHQLQAGGGPAFFHYKILCALRWAAQLRASGTPAVAVFWMASEDHDFDEVARTVGAGGEVFKWNPNRVQDAPVGRIEWDAAAESDWLAWCTAMQLSPKPVSEPMPLAHRMRHWLNEWFAGEPLVVIDGDDPALKEMALDLFHTEFDGTGIGGVLQSAADAYSARWSIAPLQPRDNNAFVLDASGVRHRADRWLQGRAADAWKALPPEAFSPNAALRPLYQERLLQSAAFAGGPSEVAYWLMLGSAFQHHAIPQPALLLRDGALVLDADAQRVADLCSWSPQQGALMGEAAVANWADRGVQGTGELEKAFEAWAVALTDHARGVPGDALPTTHAALARMEKELVQVRKKWRKFWKQHHADDAQAIARAFDTWLCPNGVPQERGLSGLVLMEAAGGGKAFRDQWYEALHGADEPRFLVFRPTN